MTTRTGRSWQGTGVHATTSGNCVTILLHQELVLSTNDCACATRSSAQYGEYLLATCLPSGSAQTLVNDIAVMSIPHQHCRLTFAPDQSSGFML
jgi:hypothetical protein